MEIKLFTQEQIEKIGKSYINITKATLTQAKYRFSLYNRNCFVTLEEFYERVIELTDHVMMKCIEYDDYYRVFALPSNSPVEININNIFQKKSNVDKNRLKTCLTNLHELLKDSFNKDLFCLLYCHYFLVQNESKWNIDNSNRPYSFNLSEKKQIMKHVIEYLMHTPLDPKMIEYIDSYFNIYGTIESNLDIIISKNNKYEDFYDTLESISTIKFWNLLVINFGFYRYYIKIYTQLDSIQNSNSYNIFLDAILKPLYTNAIYQLLRDYNPDTISYSSFLKNHINELEDIPQDVVRNDLFTEATRILSNRFSQSVTKHDVNGTYTFFSKSSTSNFDKHPSFNPLRVDSNYLDLIFLSIKNKNTSPPSELSEYNENETANDMGNRIKENIFHKIFPHARQDTQDIRSENIRDYNFLLRNHKLNSDKLPK